MRYAIFLASSSLAITFHLFSSGHSIQGCGEWKSISAVIKQKGMTFLLKKKKDCFMSVNCVIFAFFHLDSTKEITNYVFFRSVKVLSSQLVHPSSYLCLKD